MTGAEHRGIEHHHGAGDPGHAAAHQREQLAALHAHQIRADQQRRLDMADKDCTAAPRPSGPPMPDDAAQHPGEGADDALQYAPIEQQGRQRADHQHQRQCAESEDKAGARLDFGEGRRAAAEIAEDEAGAGVGRLLQRLNRVVEQQECRRGGRKFEQQQRQRELQRNPRGDHRHGTRNRSSLIAQASSSSTAIPSSPRIVSPSERVIGSASVRLRAGGTAALQDADDAAA